MIQMCDLCAVAYFHKEFMVESKREAALKSFRKVRRLTQN